MPGPKITAELLLRTDMKDVVRELDKGLSGAMRQHAKDVKKTVGSAWGDAIALALGDGRTGKAMKDFVRSGIVDAAETYQALMKQGRVADAQAQKELLEQRAKAFRREVDLRRRAFREIQDRQIETAEQAADRFKGGAEKLASLARGGGLLDALRGGGHGLQTRGRAHQERARLIQQGGGDPKQVAEMAKLGSTLAKVGATMATVAAAVGGIVVLIKLFAELESKIKDMNKALLDSAGAADFGLSAAEIRGGALRRQLEILRDETTGFNENFRKFRVSAREQQQILATLNQSGVTYGRMNEEIKKGSKFMRDYSDVTALAITYSRSLGMSTSEIAQQMGTFAFETGMSLEQIAENFTIISREAGVAGFMTKRFYGAIVEATSGMNFYGVRIEETTKLLRTFDSLLGEAAGTDAFKQIVGQYRDKGAQDRLRDFIVKDQDFVTRQFQNAFEHRMGVLTRQFGEQLAEQGTSLDRLLAEATSEADLRATLGGLGIRGQQATDIANLRRLQQGASGNQAAQMAAAGAAGPGFDAAMAIKAALPVERFGKTLGQALEQAIAEGNQGAVVAIQNLESSTGISYDRLIELSDAASGQLLELQRIRDTGQAMPKDLEKLGFFIDKQTGEFKRGIVDSNGVVTEEAKKNAALIVDEFDILASQPTEDGKALEKQLTEDQKIASEISRNITGLNDMMEQGILAVLNDIYDVILQIADFMFKDDPERQAELHLQEKMAEESKKAEESLRALKEEEKDLSTKRDEGRLTPEDQARLEALNEKIRRAEDQAEVARDAADLAKELEGDQIRKEGFLESRRQLREQAGDAEAGTEEAKATTRDLHNVARGIAGVSPESAAPGWIRKIDDFGKMLTPGSGAQALMDRAGVTGWAERQGAKIGRALGTNSYAGMTDEEMDAIFEAKQKGADSVYAERSVFKDLFGIGTVSSRVAREEAAGREVEDALYQQTEAEREQAAQMQESLRTGFKDVKEAIETGTLFDLLNPKKAKDLILPAGGGSPIITDERDTLFAGRPGGPLAASLGGGGAGAGRGGPVNIHIHGGDQRRIYDTVMRVMKATGNA